MLLWPAGSGVLVCWLLVWSQITADPLPCPPFLQQSRSDLWADTDATSHAVCALSSRAACLLSGRAKEDHNQGQKRSPTTTTTTSLLEEMVKHTSDGTQSRCSTHILHRVEGSFCSSSQWFILKTQSFYLWLFWGVNLFFKIANSLTTAHCMCSVGLVKQHHLSVQTQLNPLPLIKWRSNFPQEWLKNEKGSL